MTRLIRTTFLALLAACAVHGHRFEIYKPWGSVSWLAGRTEVIEYAMLPEKGEQPYAEPPGKGPRYEAYLLRGPDNDNEFVAEVTLDVDPYRHEILFTVPPTVEDGDDYFISMGNEQRLTYSGRFRIVNHREDVEYNADPGQKDRFLTKYKSYLLERQATKSSESDNGPEESAADSEENGNTKDSAAATKPLAGVSSLVVGGLALLWQY
ncbi:hypothetical protein H4R34_002267 [Dimargaris verticillata]|uniref:Yeast cell wall synthesis Kre9/Knh1-like N-terminal domain-containing protein n=1 Tax=Dimargaris verticillata TaxID=2761393 RepID=A0A9W8EDQ5_9FUNG|nr:hypothetical protein H4R34_002267 [Dimargaris verticillata]